MTRILVVDDVVDVTETLVGLFAAMGHQTRSAANGLEALHMARTFQPSIVFLDLAMPLLDGYQAAVAIRSDPDIVQPHLIALTAAEGIAVNNAVKAAGFDSYMKKPADTMTLIAVVTEIATRGQDRPDAQAAASAQ